MTIPAPTEKLAGADEIVEEFEGLPFKFKRLGTYKPGESWILLLYGPSKTGKTFFAGTSGPRTLYINIGEGHETLLSPAFVNRYREAAEGIIRVDVHERTDTALAFTEVCKVINTAFEKFPEKFDTIVIDEATGLRKYAMNKAMELNTEARTKGTKRESRLVDFVVTDVQDYQREMQAIEWFLGTYIPICKQTGKHLLLLAHERQTFTKPSKIGDEPILKRVLPGFTGKTFPDQIPAFFDDVWHSEAVGGGSNVVYRIRTAGSETEIGGSRHGGIFNTTEQNPNFLDMLKRIKQSHKR